MGEHRCEIIEERLNEHLDKYADNNKEILRLAIAIENIIFQNMEHFKTSEENRTKRIIEEKEYRAKLQPVLESYTTLISGRNWILKGTAFFFTLGSFYILLRQIFKH